MDVAIPGADWLTKVVTLGPPCLLVLGLIIILQAAARNKIDIKKAVILSAIVATFFGLWMIVLPELRTRRIEIVSTMSPKQLSSSYSLQPIQYRIVPWPEAKDTDLDNLEFDFPSDVDRLKLHFNLEALIRSYENNLATVIQVAQTDPDCFERAIRNNTYAKVASNILQLCPATLLGSDRQASPLAAGPNR